MIVLDTSGLLSSLYPDQNRHADCRAVLEREAGPPLLSPFVVAEMDYLIGRNQGVADQLVFLGEVETGAYRLVPFDVADLTLARQLMAKYADLRIGLTDASLVVLAARHGTRRILTLDERHFRALRGLDGQPFEVLPSGG